MLRVSATTLEAFRLWRDEDWMSEAALQATITRAAEPTREMRLGAAFGAILAAPDTYAIANGLGGIAGYQCDGFDFSAETMREPIAMFDRRGCFEVKATGTHALYNGVTARLVAKADQVFGGLVVETKTTFGTFDADRYERSYQWRAMLDVYLGHQVEYRVFSLREAANGWLDVRGLDRLTLYRYPHLHDDVRTLLSEFVDYVALRGLERWLTETVVHREDCDLDEDCTCDAGKDGGW